MLPLGEYFFYFHCEGNMRGGSGGAMLYTLYKLGMIYVAAVAGRLQQFTERVPAWLELCAAEDCFPGPFTRTASSHSPGRVLLSNSNAAFCFVLVEIDLTH